MVDVDAATNRVIVGDAEDLVCEEFEIDRVNWHPVAGGDDPGSLIDTQRAGVNAPGYNQEIEATVKVTGRTGVEMEALTAVSVAALTLYDMCKAADKGMVIERIRLEEKAGGQSGSFRRSD